jgi:4-amino-4-deoxy-L-arabinose transferase-like glycosyltransferase
MGDAPADDGTPLAGGGWYRPVGAARGSAGWWLAAFVIAWTLAAVLTHPALHHDMVETWVWGQHPALGYSKHPPLTAWMAGLWFGVMPRQDWAFYLLAYLNASAGLWAVWLLAGRLLGEDGAGANARAASVLLLCLTPFFTFQASKFNANTVLLSLWPWTAFFLVRSLESRSMASSVMLGLLAGASMLGKYYSVLLVGSCFVAAVLHPRARAYFASRAPYVAIAVFVLVLAPHVWWVVANDFEPLTYAASKLRPEFSQRFGRGTWAVVAGVLLNVPAGLVLWMALRSERSEPWSGLTSVAWARLRSGVRSRGNSWLLVLALGPYLLTYAACIFGEVRISLQFLIPVFFLWPLVVLRFLGGEIGRRGLRVVTVAAMAMTAVGLIAGPVIGVANLVTGLPAFVEPRRQVALEATRIWHEMYHQPLRIVMGEQGYAQATTFYSDDAPSELTGFDFKLAPWVTPELMAKEGAVAICSVGYEECVHRASKDFGGATTAVERTFTVSLWGVHAPARRIAFIIVPPSR